jgi:hypothetical protein
MKIDTKPVQLPDGQPPKGIDHPVAGNRLTGMGLPASLKGIRWHPVASGRLHENVTDYDADERAAIQTEQALATRQTIPKATMIAGLVRAAQWPR